MSVSNITRTEAFDEKLVTMDDEAIIEAVHQGHSEALDYLIKKYRNFVRAKARSYFLIGADKEDIVQEGMIGLYKAIRDCGPYVLGTACHLGPQGRPRIFQTEILFPRPCDFSDQPLLHRSGDPPRRQDRPPVLHRPRDGSGQHPEGIAG